MWESYCRGSRQQWAEDGTLEYSIVYWFPISRSFTKFFM